MKVEIWSDIACPWCYIGKRRFEAALQRFEHAGKVEITWRSFELDPLAPHQAEESVVEMLGRKYAAGPERVKAMLRRTTEVAASVGLQYRLETTKPVNTRDAHRLLHLAAEHGLQSDAKERLFHAYFVENADVADHETLVRLLAEVGIDEEKSRAVLAGDEYEEAVEIEQRTAADLGATGVPFFVVDRAYGVSGAQSEDVFLDVLQRAWADAHPLKLIQGDADADVCDDGTCAV